MAFKKQNLTAIATNKGGVIPSLWTYWNEGSDTVTAAGFIPANLGVKAKDQVMVIAANGSNMTNYNASITAGVITLVANA